MDNPDVTTKDYDLGALINALEGERDRMVPVYTFSNGRVFKEDEDDIGLYRPD